MIPEDPDHFVDDRTPGSQEWWYFDAISDDGRDVVVLVWYAALPFDPAYGMAAIRHLDRPDRHAAPDPREFCAFGLSWYRDGKPLAYALNGYRASDFAHSAGPFSVSVSTNVIERDASGYTLTVETPSVDARTRLQGRFQFRPAGSTQPIGRNLATEAAPHFWLLAAADCGVLGTLDIGSTKGTTLEFRGRGYHDHNAGSEEISRSQSRWAWGRAQIGPMTHVYYRAEPRDAIPLSVWITCRDGRPEVVREGVEVEESGRDGNVFGIRNGREVRLSHDGSRLIHSRDRCVDDGPFYRRWMGRFSIEEADGTISEGMGIGELLETRNLNRRLFNWMIPYRLKKPRNR